MATTTILITVYNEIKYIQKTLESVVGEADCILIGDNTSTDGSSEVCQTFASRYPEITYYRHEKNIGACRNYSFLCDHIETDYCFYMGGHDVLDKGSVKYWASILDQNADYVFVGPKKIVNLNPDYSTKDIFIIDGYAGDMESDDQYVRVKSSLKNFCNGSVIYGLSRSPYLKKLNSIMPHLDNDHGWHAGLARYGKFYVDEKHSFFRMNPHKIEIEYDERKNQLRILKAVTGKSEENINLWEWHFSIITSAYALAQEMIEAGETDHAFLDEVMDIIVKRFGPRNFVATLQNMDIRPEKEYLIHIIFEEVLKRKEMYSSTKKVSKSKKLRRKIREFLRNLV